jgi:hypothetical protein
LARWLLDLSDDGDSAVVSAASEVTANADEIASPPTTVAE